MQSSMSATPQTLEIVQSAYAAFGRGDIPAILDLIADEIEWKFVGSKGLPYTGTFRTKDAIANWFASIPKVEEILIFEHREFISAGESATVLGWERSRARPGGKVFETDWVHVFTARDGRITRYRGMYDSRLRLRRGPETAFSRRAYQQPRLGCRGSKVFSD
jgi:uncharacterized protein